MRKLGIVTAVVCVAVLFGCTPRNRDGTKGAVPVAQVQAQAPAKGAPDFEKRVIAPDKHLPTAAKNVQLFNNYWTYFELDVGGKNRKFLMHHSHPKDDWQGRESLVELRD